MSFGLSWRTAKATSFFLAAALLAACSGAPPGEATESEGESALKFCEGQPTSACRPELEREPESAPTLRARYTVRQHDESSRQAFVSCASFDTAKGEWHGRVTFPAAPASIRNGWCSYAWFSTGAAADLAALRARFPGADIGLDGTTATSASSLGAEQASPPKCPPGVSCPETHTCTTCNGMIIGGTLYGTLPADQAASLITVQHWDPTTLAKTTRNVSLLAPAHSFTVPGVAAAGVTTYNVDVSKALLVPGAFPR